MTKNTVLMAILVLAIFVGYSNSQNTSGDNATGTSSQGPASAPAVLPVQLTQAQQAAPQLQPAQSRQGAAAVQNPQPGLQAGPVQPSSGQPQIPFAQPQNQQQNMMPTSGMGCMMGGMPMGGMNGMSGMSGISATGGMGHTMDQGLTMREIVYIVSMQDALQVLSDMIQFQERVIESTGPKKDDLRKELAKMKDKTQKLSSDYRAILTSQTSR